MRLRLSDPLRTVLVGGAGAIWGLGLARLVAEAGFSLLLFRSLPAAGAIAALCAAVVLALWLRGGRSGRDVVALVPLAFPLLYVAGIVAGPLAGGALLVAGAVLPLLLLWGDRLRWMVPTVLGAVVFALYLRTLLPSVGVADTFEFQVVVPLLRVAHPTGYPLYVLLGKLFTLLPFGNVAWRVNLGSAVFATAAVLTLYALLLRLAGRGGGSVHWLPPFVAALAFALSAVFWSQAIVAEVYALHNLLVTAILWLLLDAGPLRPPRRWKALLLLMGLGLANHLTTALLLPAVMLALVCDRPGLRLRDWLIAAGLLVLGLSVYLFIPLRWPAVNDGQWMTLEQFLSHVTGGQFHGALQLGGWHDPVRWGIVGRLLREPFGWIGLGLAALGALHTALLRRRVLALLGVTFCGFMLYGLAYHVADISVFLIPVHLILAIWIGIGVAYLVELTSRLPFRWSALGRSLLVLTAMLPSSLVWRNLPQVDRSHDHGNRVWGQYVLSLPLPPGSAVLADVEKFAPLYYLQQVEGVRPDLDILILGSEELYQAEMRARLDAGQTVYLARYLPHLEGLHLRSVGPLVQVGAEEERSAREGGTLFGDEIRLLGAKSSADPLGRRLYHLTLLWQAGEPVSGDYMVRLRLLDGAGQVSWQGNGARPVGGLYPTNGWPVDTAIYDYHELPLPLWLPGGEYVLQVGLFPRFSDTGLPIGHGPTSWLTLDSLEITPPPQPLPPLANERRYALGGGAWLTGYSMAGETTAGAPFVLDLSWRDVEDGWKIRLRWVDVWDREVKGATDHLAPRAQRSRHISTAPQSPGHYALHVGMEGEAAYCTWLASPTSDCPLGTVGVVPEPQGLASFGDLVLLLEAEAEQMDIRPGESVSVDLTWRALRAMDEDYTVFVQLIGPDGRLRGQVDTWPVQGTRPTSGWTLGEEVRDLYAVRLQTDAPPGRYQVQVGWYLLATMQRLQILDTEGRPIGDSFVVGEFPVAQR